MDQSNHTCNHPGCIVQLPKNQFCCAFHWRKLPPLIRMALWESYENPYLYAKIALEAKAWLEEHK